MQNLLIGELIIAMKIAEDKKALLFITSDKKELIVRVVGGCCSETWIENVELPVNGFPAEILSIENLDMPSLGNKNEYEIITYYGCKILTDAGDIIIEYRNSSNGNYGGGLCWPGGDYYYPGVYSQNFSKNIWKNI
jgi:hypothetical protein